MLHTRAPSFLRFSCSIRRNHGGKARGERPRAQRVTVERVHRGGKRKINTLVRPCNSNRSRTIQMSVGVRSRRRHDLFLFAYPASFPICTRLPSPPRDSARCVIRDSDGEQRELSRKVIFFLIFLYLHIYIIWKKFSFSNFMFITHIIQKIYLKN